MAMKRPASLYDPPLATQRKRGASELARAASHEPPDLAIDTLAPRQTDGIHGNGSGNVMTRSKSWQHDVTQSLADICGVLVSPSAAARDVCEHGGAHDGEGSLTLSRYLHTRTYISIDQAARLLRRVAGILAQVHNRGVVYCNISPDTLVLHAPPTSPTSPASSQSVKAWDDLDVSLADFTYARWSSNETVSISSVRLDVCGDVRFISPESTGRTNRPIDARSDIYSLGMLMHSALTGDMPRDDLSVLERVHNCVAVSPRPLTVPSDGSHTSAAQAKAAAFQRLLDGMTAKLPEHRFRTCDDIIRSLDAFAACDGRWQDFTPYLSTDGRDVLQALRNGSECKLYGRGADIERLCAFQRSAYAGTGGLAIIKGSSGELGLEVGKTSLVQELALPACAMGGLFCSGKYDQYNGNIPYLAIAQACSDMINLLLADNIKVVTSVTRDICAQLGDNQSLIFDMLPNLRQLLISGATQDHPPPVAVKDQPGTQHSPNPVAQSVQHPERVAHRLQQSLSTVLAIVASHRPLTLFLDDVQWIDPSSAKLITDLVSHGMPPQLLLVLSHRTDESVTSTVFFDFEDLLARKRGNTPLCDIELDILDLGATQAVIRGILGLSPATDEDSDMTDLAMLVHERTLGNVLYIRRLVQLLIEKDILLPVDTSRSQPKWSWNRGMAQNLCPANNVINMLAAQVKDLPKLTRFVLVAAAMLGVEFDAETLANLLQLNQAVVLSALAPAFRCGYLRTFVGLGANLGASDSREDDFEVHNYRCSYRVLTEQLNGLSIKLVDDMCLAADGLRYRLMPQSTLARSASKECQLNVVTIPVPPAQVMYWVHDRLQEAVMHSIDDPDERAHVHYLVGCWQLHQLLRNSVNPRISPVVFDIVHHLKKAECLLLNEQERAGLAKLMVVAYSEARAPLQYAQQAVELLEPSAWRNHYELAFRAHHSLITAEYDAFLFDKVKEHIALVLRQDLAPADTAAVLDVQLHLCVTEMRPLDAIKYTTFIPLEMLCLLTDFALRSGKEALALLGFPVAEKSYTLDDIMQQIPSDISSIRHLMMLPPSVSARSQCAHRIISNLHGSCWTLAWDDYVRLMVNGVKIAVECGMCEHAVVSFLGVSVAMKVMGGDFAIACAYANLALHALKQLPSTDLKATVVAVYAHEAGFWTQSIRANLPILQEGLEAGKTWSNSEYAMTCAATITEYMLHSGVKLSNIVPFIADNMALTKQLGSDLSIYYFLTNVRIVKHLLQPHMPLLEGYFREAVEEEASRPFWEIHQGRVMMLMLQVIADDIPGALHSIQVFIRSNIDRLPWSALYANLLLYGGVATVRHLMLLPPDSRNCNDPFLLECITKHKEWAARCPSTFECRLNLLQGCQLWLQGDVCAAFDCLDKAVRLAQLEGFVHLEAVANETIGHLFLDVQHNVQMATPYMQAAQQAYRRWGAEWKARSLAEKYGGGGGGGGGNGSGSAAPVAAQQSSTAADVVDIETMYDWTVALGSESTQDGVVCEFMSLAVMHSGSTEARLLWTAQEAGQEDGAAGEMQCLAMSSIDALSGQIETRVRPEQQDWLTSMAPLVNYVLRTKETLTETSPAMVSLLRQCARRPHTGSILLLPILLRDQCVGILYLSNELTSGNSGGGGGGGAGDDQVEGKDSKRIVIMRLLSAQLAVTLDNMRLLDQLRGSNKALQAQTVTLEERVDERTAELADANARLQHLIVACREAERLARAAAEANRNFLHHMSHELRTPLNAIVGMVDLLLDEDGLTDEQRDKVESTALASRALMQIVNNVLDLGKIQAGKMTLNLKPFCLRNEVECAMESVAQTAAGKELTLATHFAGTVPQSLTGDGIRVGQVLRNLLSNAVKFTEQGHVLLHVTAAEIAGETGQCLFTIRCTDTGPGIAEEEAHRLFKEFSQLDSSSTRVHGGTGLGLNISKGFALLMKGDVTCESEVGRGSTFIFTFQCAAAPCGQPPLQLPPDTRIVVCHPLLVVQQMVQSYLTFNAALSSGHIICADPAELPAMLQSLQPQAKQIFILPQIPDTVPRIVLGNDRHEPAPLLSNARMPLRQVQLMRAIAQVCTGAILTLIETKNKPTRPQFPGLRVLVAEDNPMSQKLALNLLRRFGILANLAENGVEAVAACEIEDYDLILMDIQMPKMDGTTATTRIRRKLTASDRPQPTIIAQSAHAFNEDSMNYVAAGMDETVAKPLTLDILQRIFLSRFAKYRIEVPP
ncbi:hypothetical protein RI367_004590 [Sorochytrium milnesiophthora]